MKLSLDKDEVVAFKRDMAAMGKVVPKRTGQLPVLSSVRVELDSPSLARFTATDLDITFSRVSNVVAVDWEPACVPFSSLKGAVDAAARAKSALTLVADGRMLTFEHAAGSSTATLVDVDEWPALPTIDESRFLTIDEEAVRHVLPMAGKDQARPILTGVLFAADGELAATDSYKLTRVENVDDSPDHDMLVPARALELVVKVLGLPKRGETWRKISASYQVDEHYGRGHLRMSAGECQITTRLIEGSFPDYKSLLKSSPMPATIHAVADELRDAVMMVTKNAKADGAVLDYVRIADDDHKLRVEIRDGERVWSTTIAGDIEGCELVGFRPIHLLPILTDADGKSATRGVRLEGIDRLKPWQVSFARRGMTITKLVMPARID